MPQTLLVDGGLSTQLESQGVDLTQHPQLWTAGLLLSDDGRKQLSTAHKHFLEAGSDVILTASYQVSPDVNQVCADFSVSLALAARDAARIKGSSAKVYVSLGPWGATQADGSEYSGQYAEHVTRSFLKDWHTRRLELLLKNNWNNVDGLAFETIPSMLELRAIMEVLGNQAKPAWTTFSSPDGVHLCDGTPIVDAFALCDELTKADEYDRYFGLNCVHPDTINPFLDAILPLATVSRGSIAGITVYPNNGGTWDADERCWKDAAGGEAEGEGFSLLARKWRERVEAVGLSFMCGGCCSTDAKTIRKLKESLKNE